MGRVSWETLAPWNPFECGDSVNSQWALTFSRRAACYYTGLWRSSEWLFVACDVLREREMFRLNGSVSLGEGRVEEEAVLRSRCGFNCFNRLRKVERFDVRAAGA